MLCDHNVREDGSIAGQITYCNIEGYGGLDPVYLNDTRRMLATMPHGRCPWPPGDVPGPGPGFNAEGHWIGVGQ